MKAIIAENKQVHLRDVPVPKPKPGELLVKVKAAAQNPTDWKHVDYLSPDGVIVGCDFAGVVEDLGEGVTSPAKGTRVAGFIQGAFLPELGSFAEYVRADASLVWRIPDKTNFEDAAAIGGIAMETAAQALFARLKLATPFTPVKDAQETVLIWAGSTSVGQYAIQLAHSAGYKVVTTASPKNFDLVKSLGANDVYDYRDPETSTKIKTAHPGIKTALDCVSEVASIKQATHALATGGVLVTLLASCEGASTPGIEVREMVVYTTRGYTFSYGPGRDFPADPEDKAFMAGWLKEFPRLLDEDRFAANRVKILGGLDKVAEGIEYMKSGKVSAEKLVYII